jgi:hypothetical protein
MRRQILPQMCSESFISVAGRINLNESRFKCREGTWKPKGACAREKVPVIRALQGLEKTEILDPRLSRDSGGLHFVSEKSARNLDEFSLSLYV